MAIDGKKPYAAELAYVSDDEYIYFGFSPNGRIAKCVSENPNVAFKMCDSHIKGKRWRAVIIEGKAERVMGREEIFGIIRSLAKGLELPEDYWDEGLTLLPALRKNPPCISFLQRKLEVDGRFRVKI